MTVKRIPTEHAGGKWRLSFIAAAGGTGTLELDVNYMLRSPLWPTEVRSPSALPGVPTPSKFPILDPPPRLARRGEVSPRVRRLRRSESCRLADRRSRGGHNVRGGRHTAAPPDASERPRARQARHRDVDLVARGRLSTTPRRGPAASGKRASLPRRGQ